jgi:hypothetical protein
MEYTYYFDLNNSDHTDLIPDANVDPANATTELAQEAEREVVDLYTIPRDGHVYICLDVYDPESMDESETEVEEFLDNAFLPAVAEQVGWKLLKRQQNPLYSSHRLGDESRDFEDGMLQQKYPPNFERHLRRYDTRPIL